MPLDRSHTRPSTHDGLCRVCAGTGMMPRSAPPEIRTACESCGGIGASR